MTDTLAQQHHRDEDREAGLNWPRITGIAFAIAVHLGALLLLLAPVSPPTCLLYTSPSPRD